DQNMAAGRSTAATAASTGPSTPATTMGGNLSKNEQQRLEARVAEIEKQIAKLEAEAADAAVEMSKPEVAADFKRLDEIAAGHRKTEARIQELYAEWQAAADKPN